MITLDIHETNSVRLRRVEFKAEETTRGEPFSVLEIAIDTNDGKTLIIKTFSGRTVPVTWDGEA